MFVLPSNAFGRLTHQQVHTSCKRVIRRMGDAVIAASGPSTQVYTKTSYDGIPDGDSFTDGDLNSQAVLKEEFPELFEGFGLQAEEGEYTVEATLITPNGPVVMTADPLDGTKWYIHLMQFRHEERDGVYVMLAIRLGKYAVAAYLLDVFSGELTYLAPGEHGVFKETSTGMVIPLPTVPPAATFGSGKLIVHGSTHKHTGLSAWLTLLQAAGMAPEVQEITKSIGDGLLYVADGRAVGLARRPLGHHTPWDDTPLVALCLELGIRTFWVLPDGSLREYRTWAPLKKWQRRFGVLYLWPDYIEALCQHTKIRVR